MQTTYIYKYIYKYKYRNIKRERKRERRMRRVLSRELTVYGISEHFESENNSKIHLLHFKVQSYIILNILDTYLSFSRREQNSIFGMKKDFAVMFLIILIKLMNYR